MGFLCWTRSAGNAGAKVAQKVALAGVAVTTVAVGVTAAILASSREVNPTDVVFMEGNQEEEEEVIVDNGVTVTAAEPKWIIAQADWINNLSKTGRITIKIGEDYTYKWIDSRNTGAIAWFGHNKSEIDWTKFDFGDLRVVEDLKLDDDNINFYDKTGKLYDSGASSTEEYKLVFIKTGFASNAESGVKAVFVHEDAFNRDSDVRWQPGSNECDGKLVAGEIYTRVQIVDESGETTLKWLLASSDVDEVADDIEVESAVIVDGDGSFQRDSDWDITANYIPIKVFESPSVFKWYYVPEGAVASTVTTSFADSEPVAGSLSRYAEYNRVTIDDDGSPSEILVARTKSNTSSSSKLDVVFNPITEVFESFQAGGEYAYVTIHNANNPEGVGCWVKNDDATELSWDPGNADNIGSNLDVGRSYKIVQIVGDSNGLIEKRWMDKSVQQSGYVVVDEDPQNGFPSTASEASWDKWNVSKTYIPINVYESSDSTPTPYYVDKDVKPISDQVSTFNIGTTDSEDISFEVNGEYDFVTIDEKGGLVKRSDGEISAPSFSWPNVVFNPDTEKFKKFEEGEKYTSVTIHNAKNPEGVGCWVKGTDGKGLSWDPGNPKNDGSNLDMGISYKIVQIKDANGVIEKRWIDESTQQSRYVVVEEDPQNALLTSASKTSSHVWDVLAVYIPINVYESGQSTTYYVNENVYEQDTFTPVSEFKSGTKESEQIPAEVNGEYDIVTIDKVRSLIKRSKAGAKLSETPTWPHVVFNPETESFKKFEEGKEYTYVSICNVDHPNGVGCWVNDEDFTSVYSRLSSDDVDTWESGSTYTVVEIQNLFGSQGSSAYETRLISDDELQSFPFLGHVSGQRYVITPESMNSTEPILSALDYRLERIWSWMEDDQYSLDIDKQMLAAAIVDDLTEGSDVDALGQLGRAISTNLTEPQLKKLAAGISLDQIELKEEQLKKLAAEISLDQIELQKVETMLTKLKNESSNKLNVASESTLVDAVAELTAKLNGSASEDDMEADVKGGDKKEGGTTQAAAEDSTKDGEESSIIDGVSDQAFWGSVAGVGSGVAGGSLLYWYAHRARSGINRSDGQQDPSSVYGRRAFNAPSAKDAFQSHRPRSRPYSRMGSERSRRGSSAYRAPTQFAARAGRPMVHAANRMPMVPFGRVGPMGQAVNRIPMVPVGRVGPMGGQTVNGIPMVPVGRVGPMGGQAVNPMPMAPGVGMGPWVRLPIGG